MIFRNIFKAKIIGGGPTPPPEPSPSGGRIVIMPDRTMVIMKPRFVVLKKDTTP